MTNFSQSRELTELRKDVRWLDDLPRNVCTQVLVDLDKAWQRCFKKLSAAPRWKRRGRDSISFTETNPKAWRLMDGQFRFPKLGIMRICIHRPIEGIPKRCTLLRDGDEWFVSIVCEISEPEPVPLASPVVAIDRGITNLLADSNGNLTPNPKFYDKTMVRLKRAQREVARRKKGSNRQAKAKNRVMRLHRKVRRQREHVLHVESSRLAKSHGVVVIEKLNVQGMAKGKWARNIATAGWSRFASMLRYKLAQRGGCLVEVPAAYSSQTCSACGCVAADSRHRERFRCIGCGYSDHADLNAAKVLKQRYEAPGNPWCLRVDGSLPEGSGRNAKAKVKLRVPRGRTSQSST